jgi:hypothetical protein
MDASKEVGLEVDVEKTKYMLVSHHQNAEQYRDIMPATIQSRTFSLFVSKNLEIRTYKTNFACGSVWL